MMGSFQTRSSVVAVALLVLAVWVAGVEAQDPSLVLADGGIQFPDGTVQNSALIGFAPVEDTGQDKCWDAAGTEIACSGTGHDGELQRGVDWPAPRFTDNGNGTVTDNLTGLIWLQLANCFGTRNWTEALSDANGLMTGQCGLADGSVATDWRLPNVKELSSLIDYGEAIPALPSGHPFSMVPSLYWTSSSIPVASSGDAWYVHLGFGIVGLTSKSSSGFGWPVRGGQ